MISTVSPVAVSLASLLVCIGWSATPASAQRTRTAAAESAEALVTPAAQAAAARGLVYLAQTQHPDGYWIQDIGFKLNTDYKVNTPDAPHIGVTALALMAFMAGGHLPDRGQYGSVLENGLSYVLSAVRADGQITDHGSRMYSHAFATLFLAEIYGMTLRADVRRALQAAVNIIVDSQNREGGWRYRPFARESDMSITVCQVLALRSARNVGIAVPARTVRDAERYVRLSAVHNGDYARDFHSYAAYNEGGAFRYQLRPHSRATFPLTAAGVTTLHAAGIYDDPIIDDAFRYMDDHMPEFNRHYFGHYFFYYGHYYAVQAYYTAGEPFKRYFPAIRDRLLDRQREDGSWQCDEGPGDAFATAVSALILQIPYQYLPIFQR